MQLFGEQAHHNADKSGGDDPAPPWDAAPGQVDQSMADEADQAPATGPYIAASRASTAYCRLMLVLGTGWGLPQNAPAQRTVLRRYQWRQRS